MARTAQSQDGAGTESDRASIAEIEQKRVDLPQGPIAFREVGQGPPVVFVHGLLVDGRLWNGVADQLSSRCRCIVPDWPMGSHRLAMRPDADLTPPGTAGTVADFIAALGLDDVTLVGNDTGGAITQILVTSRPERIGRLVLTNCDSYEHFPPGVFKAMPAIAKLPGGMAAMAAPFRIGALRRATFAQFVKKPFDPRLPDAWLEPSLHDRDVMRDLRKFTAGVNKRYTLEAAKRFGQLEMPVLLVWGTDDGFFKLSHAERLAAAIPNSRIETIPDAKTFVPLDQPAAVADAIAGFAAPTTK
jgi:pimeloyl-ACP methyl ester carboxylesterase